MMKSSSVSFVAMGVPQSGPARNWQGACQIGLKSRRFGVARPA
jgi:hypothetical protein